MLERHEDAMKASAAIEARVGKQREQLADVGTVVSVLSGKARGANTRPAAERINDEPRVVGNRR
jgi:hypothetical protein